MKIRGAHTRPPRVEMLPLIDVVFLLLVVFIYAMLSMAVHKGLPVALPLADRIQQTREQPLSVTVEADGAVFLNKIPVPLKDLAATIKQHPDVNAETGVLLFADNRLPYQQLFDVLDRIREAGLSRISLQARARASR
jgi:biopolymer transport protein ExbD